MFYSERSARGSQLMARSFLYRPSRRSSQTPSPAPVTRHRKQPFNISLRNRLQCLSVLHFRAMLTLLNIGINTTHNKVAATLVTNHNPLRLYINTFYF